MPTTLLNKFEQISLILLNNGEKVFSGNIHQINEFENTGQVADHAKILGHKNEIVISMSYDDLRILMQDQITN